MRARERHHQIGVPTAAVAAALVLGGCTAAPGGSVGAGEPGAGATAPTPGPAGPACEPATAEVSWEPAGDGPARPLAFRVLTVAADGSQSTQDEVLGYETTVSSAELGYVDIHDQEWVEFLLEDFERTGQTTRTDLGDPEVDLDAIQSPEAEEGVYVWAYEISQIYAPFTLECSGDVAGSGQLVTSGTDRKTVLVECGEPVVGDEPLSAPALERCPTA